MKTHRAHIYTVSFFKPKRPRYNRDMIGLNGFEEGIWTDCKRHVFG